LEALSAITGCDSFREPFAMPPALMVVADLITMSRWHMTLWQDHENNSQNVYRGMHAKFHNALDHSMQCAETH
jgi:hypothetical protein